jgi:hypothetical protein
MTRMVQTHHVRIEKLPRTLGGRLSCMGRKVRRALDGATVTAEIFPPVVLVSALALYFYILACMGSGGDGPSP